MGQTGGNPRWRPRAPGSVGAGRTDIRGSKNKGRETTEGSSAERWDGDRRDKGQGDSGRNRYRQERGSCRDKKTGSKVIAVYRAVTERRQR